MKGCFFNRFAIVAIFALFGISRYATATEISPEEAKIAVANWVARGYSLGKLTGRQISSAELVVDSETGAELRVVKFCGGGFVVTAADDLVDPILAFSENGDGIDLDESNPFWSLLRADIASREESCGVVRSNSKRTLKAATASELVRQSENGGVKTTGRTAAQRKWDDLLERGSVMRLASSSGMSSISDVRVEPFISTKWNQSTAGGKNCWNYYTPNNYPCGCVATAIAQIMRYWKYPTLPVEAKARECYVDDNQVTKSMYGGTYDWSLMQLAPSYSSVPTDAQCQAMGKLTYDVGVSVEMNWGATESGSWLAAGMPALTEDFHFANAIVLMYQSGYYDYSLEEFKKAAIPNLDAHQPLALGIYGSGGHAILVDGYGFSDDSFYIHANMGWSGYCDVWYCPPDIQNYTAIEEVLCNISPTKKGNILSGRVVDDQNVPIAGATVVLLSGETELLTTTTDDKGIYSFVSEKTGAFTISASAGGMSASVSGNLSTTTPLELADHEGSNRSGRYYYTSCAIGNSHGNDIVLGNGTPMFSLVTLEQQDGTGGTSSVKATYGNPMPTISPPEHPTSGYSFAGYWTEPFGSGTQYYFSTGESARNWDRMANTTLYAFWTLDDAPSCDNFADSRTIFGATGSAAFCNVGYTKEQGEPEHSRRENVWGHSSAWASWIPEVSGDYTFYLQGSSTNMVAMPEEIKTMVSVYKGTSVKSLSLVASDDGTPNSSASSRLSFHAEAGVEYKIAMDTYAAIQGILTLRWEEGYVHWIKIEYSSLFAPRPLVLSHLQDGRLLTVRIGFSAHLNPALKQAVF